MLLCLLWFVAVCSCSGLWGSSFELRFVSSDDILAWVGHLRAMLWFQFQLFRFAIPVLSQSVSVPVCCCCCCWCFCMLDKGAVGSATDEWGICRHIVKYVWGLGIAQTCGHMWMYKIVQDLPTFAKWPVGRVSAQNVSSNRPCGREDVCREAFIEARWSTTFKIFQANFKLSSRSIPRYFKQVYDQQQQIDSAGTLGSWREFTRSRACYLPDLCPWPQMFPLLISPATHFLYFCHFLAVGSVYIRHHR